MSDKQHQIAALEKRLAYYQDFHEHVKNENGGVMCEKDFDPSTGQFNCDICWPENNDYSGDDVL